MAPLAASALLLVSFVLRQVRATEPLLPLHIVLDRNRGGAYLAVALGIAGMFGAFLFLTYYLQVVLLFSPLRAPPLPIWPAIRGARTRFTPSSTATGSQRSGPPPYSFSVAWWRPC